jgi:hypothetical protein
MKLLYVEWIDASSGPGWQTVEAMRDQQPLYCRSVGWLIHENKDHLLLAASTYMPDRYPIMQATCDISIPLGMVKKRKVLRIA